jgi:hypothetical protein
MVKVLIPGRCCAPGCDTTTLAGAARSVDYLAGHAAAPEPVSLSVPFRPIATVNMPRDWLDSRGDSVSVVTILNQ